MADKAQECKCPVPLQPMEAWIEGGEEEECRPCMLGPVVQWYESELREQGSPDLADDLVRAAQEATPAALARKLDTIKEKVGDSLRERLREFDCAAQTEELDAAETEDA